MEKLKNGFWNKALKVLVIWGLSTMLSMALNRMGIREENLLLIFVVGVLISIVETSSIAWGIGAAVMFVFSFNFFFITPVYTFAVDDPNYIISFIIFIIVAAIVSSLTVKLQRQMIIANRKTEITMKMNQIGSGFLTLSGYQAIGHYSEESLRTLTGRQVSVLLKEEEKEEFDDSRAEWCYRHAMPCGFGQTQFPREARCYLPVRSSCKTYGAVVIDCSRGALQEDERMSVDTVLSQLTLVLEREHLNRERERGRLEMERERLKSTLLRSISHDLRTPLTGIAGSSNFLYDNLEDLDQETVKSMLKDICSDAEWLNSMVENLLNMTRIQEGRLKIHKKREVVDDLITSAVQLVSKRVGEHKLLTKTPDEILLLPVDGRLFIQVLVNLLDNAFLHSGKQSTVTISAACQKDRGCIRFVVSDDGVGIPADKMEQIFDNFFTTAYQNGDRQRGVGLGLTICKAIVEAHGGSITVSNHDGGGASFQIEMPMEEKNDV